jgi:hypothetical protein
MNCAKCQGAMEPEVLVKDMPYPGIVEGGTRKMHVLQIETVDNRHTVVTYRCQLCGDLESYAEEKAK